MDYNLFKVQMNKEENELREAGKESFSIEDLIGLYCKVANEESINAENMAFLCVYLSDEWNFDVQEKLEGGLQGLINLIQACCSKGLEAEKISVDSMSGVEFEQLTKTLLEKMGLEVEMTKATGDGGVDLIAYSRQAFLGGKYIVQCKRWSSSVGEPPVRDLYGVVMSENANKGILITNSTFTSNAVEFAKGKPLELIDGNALHQLLSKYNIQVSNTTTYEDSSLEDIYDWDKITLMRKELRRNNSNHNLRMQLISKLQFNLLFSFSDYSRKQLLAICEIMEEQLAVLGNLKCSPSDKNLSFLKYTSYVALSQVNLLRGDLDSAVRNLSKVFEWEELRNTIEKGNNLEDLYINCASNLMQLLYFIGLDEKARAVKIKHYGIFNENIQKLRRIVAKKNLTDDLRNHYLSFANNLENCTNTGEFTKFEYSWHEGISDVNRIYKKLKYGMGYLEYSMAEIDFIDLNQLQNGVYCPIFDLDENKLPELRRVFNVII